MSERSFGIARCPRGLAESPLDSAEKILRLPAAALGGAMSRDTLSDLLRAVRLHGAVFYYVKGYPPWVVENPHAREIIPAIMPGAEHMIEFHALVTGSCWAGLPGEPPIQMEAGDVVLFPQGDPHTMSEKFLGLLWGDLMTGLLLRVADRPSAAEIARRARDTTTAFLQIHPEPG